MATALPQFAGPARLRQRMRLAAAVGMLAVAALVTGGLAAALRHAESGVATPDGESSATPSPVRVGEPMFPDLLDPTALVENRVEEAEQAQVRAWAALRSAHQLGLVDERALEQFEQRLRTGHRVAVPAATDQPQGDTNENAARAVPEPRSRAL